MGATHDAAPSRQHLPTSLPEPGAGARCGPKVGAGRASTWPGALTAREREVAALVASGATDREVARALGISPRTVHKHLQQVYRKSGLTNRAGLIVSWLADHTAPDARNSSTSAPE